MSSEPRRPYSEFICRSTDEGIRRSGEFLDLMRRRRTVREFSSAPVSEVIVQNCLEAAATAPSGANMQPWTFVSVTDSDVRRQLREAAESEERSFYAGRASEEWLEALTPFGTDDRKPFLASAPVLIAVFGQSYSVDADGARRRHYYVNESVGIAVGMLLTALHHSGLATLTHTPSPMRFLNEILGRPESEKAFLLIVAGYPAADCTVPDISRKPLSEVIVRV